MFSPSMFNMQFILEMVLARAGPMPGASLILIPCSKLLVCLVLDSVWPPGIGCPERFAPKLTADTERTKSILIVRSALKLAGNNRN